MLGCSVTQDQQHLRIGLVLFAAVAIPESVEVFETAMSLVTGDPGGKVETRTCMAGFIT